MATRTQVVLSCDVCGNANDVRTRAFGLDGKSYEIDLCPKDSRGLSDFAAGYVSGARKVIAGNSLRRGGRKPRSQAETAGIGDRGRVRGMKRQKAKATSKRAARTTRVGKKKGIYVYGILPADIEVAADMPGVGEHPGRLRAVRSNGLAALISEVNLSGRRLGSPDDLRIHREILDATATEVPVFPLRFGTVVGSEDAVAEEVLAAHHDEFADVLERLEGRAEFVVEGHYAEEGATAEREQDTRTLEHAMEGICVASVARRPSHELGAVNVAFLVAVDRESDVERVIGDLARAWEGRIEVQLLGPMAPYDFARTAKPEG